MTRDSVRCDERTKAYAARRTAQGKSRREIIRCLKRHIAREIHQLLTDPPAVPQGAHLRHLRHSAGVTIADAAQAISAHTNRLSELERGTRHNHDLAIRYHNWLTQNPRFREASHRLVYPPAVRSVDR